jgi:hypothetical protein
MGEDISSRAHPRPSLDLHAPEWQAPLIHCIVPSLAESTRVRGARERTREQQRWGIQCW